MAANPAAPLVLLMGPTASGKSGLALELVDRIGGEIVSVDSAQVYRGMDIGTAKPPAAVRTAVPHHLVDVCDPAEHYSAARFRDDALRAIEGIRGRGRVPLLAGGTMLYFRALQQGLSGLPPEDPGMRAGLAELARRGCIRTMPSGSSARSRSSRSPAARSGTCSGTGPPRPCPRPWSSSRSTRPSGGCSTSASQPASGR
jgi:hypothetical protein